MKTMNNTLAGVMLNHEICLLAERTGYPVEFLMDRWIEECVEGDADWEQFRGITLELDW